MDTDVKWTGRADYLLPKESLKHHGCDPANVTVLQRATDDAKEEENLAALEIPGLQRDGVAIAHIEG